MRGPRIMLYSQDGRGLGHLRRAHAISARLCDGSPDAAVLMVTDSPLGRFFESPPGCDFLKLPSVVKIGPGEWRPLDLPLPIEMVRGLRSKVLLTIADQFRPDVLLVDHMPHGAQGELLTALAKLRSRGETSILLGLRDILDAPETIRSRWREEGAYDAIERHYDRVLVYGQRDIFDHAEQYALAPSLAAKINYCGYVCTPQKARYARRIKQEMLSGAAPGTKLVVAMAGGGADAFPVMRTVIESASAINAAVPCRFVVIAGPLMPAEQRRQLAGLRVPGVSIRVRKSVSDTLSYIDAADTVVGMAGYNTTVEVLRAGRPLVLIPRAGPSAEQRIRAELFEERKWVAMVPPEQLEPDTLTGAVVHMLHHPNESLEGNGSTVPAPRLDGLSVAVDHVLECCTDVIDLVTAPVGRDEEPSGDALAV